MDGFDFSKGDKSGFLAHMMQFNDETKWELMNTLQYVLIAILPVILVNKLMNRFVPEADDTKSSFELLMEILLQLAFLFISIFYIHRFIIYFPTYSGEKYPEMRVTNFVLIALVIILSLQSKLGEKVSILNERVMDAFGGDSSSSSKKGNAKKSGASVPHGSGVAGQTAGDNSQMVGMTPFQVGMGGGMSTGASAGNGMMPSPQTPTSSPDFNAMYASSPGTLEGFSGGPLPANAFGSSLGAAF